MDTQWDDARKRKLFEEKSLAVKARAKELGGTRDYEPGLRARVRSVEVERAVISDESEAKARVRHLDFAANRTEHDGNHFRFVQKDLLGNADRIKLDRGIVAVVVRDQRMTSGNFEDFMRGGASR